MSGIPAAGASGLPATGQVAAAARSAPAKPATASPVADAVAGVRSAIDEAITTTRGAADQVTSLVDEIRSPSSDAEGLVVNGLAACVGIAIVGASLSFGTPLVAVAGTVAGLGIAVAASARLAENSESIFGTINNSLH